MNLRTLRTIIELFEASSAVEMEIDNSTIGKLRLRRPESGGVAPAVSVLPDLESVLPAPAAPRPTAQAEPAADDSSLATIESPFVGTFYRSPTPESDAFCDVGDRVRKGQTLCIIEAMKLMNELEAECDGVVEAILVSNATAVEHGQALIKIRPA
jgi:acetyl-CoA carboxylase biotin carboxyl carrier protein